MTDIGINIGRTAAGSSNHRRPGDEGVQTRPAALNRQTGQISIAAFSDDLLTGRILTVPVGMEQGRACWQKLARISRND